MAEYNTHTGLDVGSRSSIDQYAGFGTAFLNPDRFTLEMGDRIHMLGAGSSPFLSWLQMVRTKPTPTYTFSWIESELFTQRDLKCRMHRSIEDTGAANDCMYVLQLDTPADWQAFMTAATADQPWDSDLGDSMPLVYLTVYNPTSNNGWSCTIGRNAMELGATTRDFVSDATGDPTAFSSLKNGICIYDDAESADNVGGVTSDVFEITATPSGLNVDFSTGFATEFDDTFFGGDTSSVQVGDVYVTISTPNDFLKGYVQGSGLPMESRKRTRSLRNFTQIFKTPYSMANTLIQIGANGMLLGGNELQRIRYNKGIEHKIDIESAIMFQGGGVEGTNWGELPGGTRIDPAANSASLGYYGSQVSSSENPLTRFKGLGIGLAVNGLTSYPGFIETKNADLDSRYVFANTSTPDMGELNRLMAMVFDDTVDNPSTSKTLFCSQKWLMELAKIGLQENSGSTLFTFGTRVAAPGILGIIIKEIVTPVGRLDCVHLPRLRGKYENYGLVVDWANMEYRPMSGRDTMLKSNVATEDLDGQLDYYLTEAGFECRHESTHAVLKLAG